MYSDTQTRNPNSAWPGPGSLQAYSVFFCLPPSPPPQYLKVFMFYLLLLMRGSEAIQRFKQNYNRAPPCPCPTTVCHCLLTVLPWKDQESSSRDSCSSCVCQTQPTATPVLLIAEIAMNFSAQKILIGISHGTHTHTHTGVVVWGNKGYQRSARNNGGVAILLREDGEQC